LGRKKSSGKKWAVALQIASQIAIVIVAIAALFVAVQSYRIAERSYELFYQSNLPVISAITETYYNEESRLYTEKIIVYNGGGPAICFGGYAYAMMQVEFSDRDVKTYIPLEEYFAEYEYSGNSQGLLLTTFTGNNYSNWLSIYNGFTGAASEDGYEPYISTTFILSVCYDDYNRQSFSRYFFAVYSIFSFNMGESEAREILDSADEIGELATSAGLSLYIWSLDGRELWEWYKVEILQD